MNCKECGKEITKKQGRGRNPLYCDECRKLARIRYSVAHTYRVREEAKRRECIRIALLIVAMLSEGKAIDDIANLLYNTFKKRKES